MNFLMGLSCANFKKEVILNVKGQHFFRAELFATL